MRNTCIAGICSLMLLFALIACDSSGGNDTPPPKPGALSPSASYEQVMSKLDEIIAYCNSHSGNDRVKADAESLKDGLPSLQSTWDSVKSTFITYINTNLISQLTESGSENPGGNEFIPVTDITDVPQTVEAGEELTLTGTVFPRNAANQSIVWSVKDEGTTGATITSSTLNTLATGTVIVTATIAHGASATTDYSKDFTITVTQTKILAFIAITTEPTKKIYTVGDTLDPADMVVTATYSDYTTAEITDYTITGFDSTAAADSQTVTVNYTEKGVTQTADFTVRINPAPGGGNISITQPGSDDPVLTVSTVEPPGGYAADFTITAPTGYSSYKWLLDGTIQTGTSNSFTVPVTTLGTGSHSVTLIAGNYSATKNFKVQ